MIASRPLLIPSNLKHNNFDLIRLMLALVVLYSHCFIIFYGTMDAEPGVRFTQNQVQLGTLAVYGFFIISGFLILRSFENSATTLGYFKKRALRIGPGFFVAFLLSILVAGPLGTIDSAHPMGNWARYFSELSFKRLLLDLFSMQTPHPPATFETLPLIRKVNSSLWTIQHEAVCYMLVPMFAAWGLLRKKYVWVAVFGCAFIIAALLEIPKIAEAVSFNTKLFNYPTYLPAFLTYFLGGSFFYIYRKRLIRSRWIAVACCLVLIAAARWGGFVFLFPFAGTYLMFYVAFHPTICFPNFAQRGDLSYGTYLYAWPVQQLTLYLLQDRIGINTFFLLSTFITLIFAWLSWHFVEQPFLQLKKGPTAKQSIGAGQMAVR